MLTERRPTALPSSRLTRLALVIVGVTATASARGDGRGPSNDPDIIAIQKLEKAGKYAEGVPLAEQLLARREKQRGSKSAEVAEAEELLGELRFGLTQYAEARTLYERALAIREVVFGKDSLEVATPLNAIAVLSRRLGEYERARPLFERALRIQRLKMAPTDPELATTLNNLGLLYRTLGEYERARPLYEQALAIWEKGRGPKDPLVAIGLHNLAAIYRALNEPALALPYVERSLAIRQEVLGAEHPHVAASLNLEGGVYEDLGEYDKAEALYVRTLALRERTLGAHNDDVAVSINNLGRFYLRRRKLDLAAPLLARSLSLRQEMLGANHPGTATALASWGEYLLDQRRYDEGRRYLRRAQQIDETAFGPVHPELVGFNSYIAGSYAAQRRPEAVALYEQGLGISESVLRRDLLGADETGLAAFFDAEEHRNDQRYSLVLQFPKSERARQVALATALLRKGRLAIEAKLLTQTIRASLKAPEDQEQLVRLLDLRRRIAGLELKAVMPEHQGRVEAESALHAAAAEAQQLALQAAAIEEQLAHSSAPLRMQRQLPEPAAVVAAVAHQLPPQTALVELVLFRPIRFEAGPDVPSSMHENYHYLALVLAPNGDVKSSDLGDASTIDRAVAALREALSKPGSAPNATRALAKLLMGRMGPLLGGCAELYISPDGELNLVPFAALDDGKGALLDRYRLTYLTSGLDLLPDPRPPTSRVVVLADPDFHADGARLAVSTRGSEPETDSVAADDAPLSDNARGSPWHRLLGTRREAEDIRQLLPQARLLLGADATKAALLHLAAPGILHIATHGLFLEDPDATAPAKIGPAGTTPTSRVPRNPLLRSAMVLAGANGSHGDATQGPDGADNGLVTALEIAEMDLAGTQLVVLSACDTGRGQVKRGQGVYGLRRAFRIAGAETLVMSLWKIDDETTRDLMGRYYRKLIAGEGRTEAMRQTMKEIRGEHADPNYWAPFFVLGRAEPLRGIHPTAQ